MSKARRPAPAPKKPAGAATTATIALALALVAALIAVALWAAGSPATTPEVDVPPPRTGEVVAPPPRATETPRPPVRPPAPEPEREPEPEPEPAARPKHATAWIKGPTETARVKRVIDGDTLELADGRRVRLVGINTPEKDEPLYAEATAALKELVEGQQVTLEYDQERTDQYKRTLAYVFKGEIFANGEVVRRGLAYCYTWEPNTRHKDELITFQREARAARLGLWALPPPAPERVYVADERGHRFHRPSCARVPRIRSKLEFRSRDEALDAGQNACGECRP